MAIQVLENLGSSFDGTSGSAMSFAVGSPVAAGEAVLLAFGYTSGNVPTIVVSDPKGNTYVTSSIGQRGGTTYSGVAASIITTPLEIGDVITVSLGINGNRRFLAGRRATGLASATPEAVGAVTSSATSAFQTYSIASLSDGALLWGGEYSGVGGPYTGWTPAAGGDRAIFTDPMPNTLVAYWWVLGAAGTYTAGGTSTGGTGSRRSAGAVYTAAAGGGSTPAVIPALAASASSGSSGAISATSVASISGDATASSLGALALRASPRFSLAAGAVANAALSLKTVPKLVGAAIARLTTALSLTAPSSGVDPPDLTFPLTVREIAQSKSVVREITQVPAVLRPLSEDKAVVKEPAQAAFVRELQQFHSIVREVSTWH